MRARFTRLILPVAVTFFLAVFVFFPVLRGIAGTVLENGVFTFSRYQELLGPAFGSTVEATANSVLVSALTVVLGGGLGVLLALGVTLQRFRFRALARALAVIPVAMPPLVGVIALLFVFGEGGFLPRLAALLAGISPDLLSLSGMAGIVVVHVYAFHVYTFLFVSGALAEIDGSLMEASEMLGAGPYRTFFRVIFPELVPSIVGAASLTFMSSMASFSAPFLFGSGTPYLTTLIYSTKLNGDLDLAGAQSALLLLVSLLFFLLLTLSTRRGHRRAERKGVSAAQLPRFPPAVERTIVGLVVALLVLEMLPVVMVLLISFAGEGSWTVQLLPDSYTLGHYVALIRDPAVLEPVSNSLMMSFLAVIGAAIVGSVLAFVLVKGSLRRYRSYLDPLFSATFAIPGTVVAVFLIITFGAPQWFTGGMVLVGTFWILPLAYFIRTYPFVLRSVSSSLDAVDQSTIEAASMFGAGGWSNVRLVILPMIAGGIISGALLVLITSLGEFPSSILLYTHSSRPIAVEILSQLRSYNFGSAGAYSAGLLILVGIFSFVARRLSAGGKGATKRFSF